MITSLTTRYRVVFTLSLVLCVLLVSGVPVDAQSTSSFTNSGGKDAYPRSYYGTILEANNVPYAAVVSVGPVAGGRHIIMMERPALPVPQPTEPESESERRRSDDREPAVSERCSVEWGPWYVDAITHVIPKLQINTLTNVTTGIPVMSKLSVTTKYIEKRHGEVICRVYIDGSYSHSRSGGTRTQTRQRERTDYNSIKVIDHTGDLTVLRINETSGDLVLQWSNRYDAYRVHIDVVLFEGSLKQNLPIQVYIWPNEQTTSAIKVQTYRSIKVD